MVRQRELTELMEVIMNMATTMRMVEAAAEKDTEVG